MMSSTLEIHISLIQLFMSQELMERALFALSSRPPLLLLVIHYINIYSIIYIGYKTGLYINPPIDTIREQIQIDGKYISVADFVKYHQMCMKAYYATRALFYSIGEWSSAGVYYIYIYI